MACQTQRDPQHVSAEAILFHCARMSMPAQRAGLRRLLWAETASGGLSRKQVHMSVMWLYTLELQQRAMHPQIVYIVALPNRICQSALGFNLLL